MVPGSLSWLKTGSETSLGWGTMTWSGSDMAWSSIDQRGRMNLATGIQTQLWREPSRGSVRYPHMPSIRNPRKEFDREARTYDETATATMPLYSELHQMIVWGAPHLRTRPIRILELGSGTGNLTALLLETFPHAHVKALDISPTMVSISRKKLRRWSDRLEIHVGELDDWPESQPLDAIVSCLAIHHLKDDRKEALFAKIHRSLRPGGYFGDGDDHLPEDSRFDERFAALANRLTTAGKGRDNPLAIQKVWHEHELYDYPVPVSREIEWLRSAGFLHVDTPWRFFNQAVVWAYK